MDSIIRGTNATIQIKIKDEIDFSTITSLELYVDQPGNKMIFNKNLLDLDPENKTITYKLSQEESLSLNPNRSVRIYAIGIANGDRFETRPIIKTYVEPTSKDEVMT